MKEQKANYYQVKATFGGKHKNQNIKIKGFSYTGVVVSTGKKPTEEQIKQHVLERLEVKCEDHDVTMTEKVEIKKLKVDFFFVYK